MEQDMTHDPDTSTTKLTAAIVGGIERTGRKWSAGPTIGTTWAIPDDHPRRMSLVHRSAIGPDWSAADQDQPLKERAQ
jgi:long-subunit fatty acid transport protein